MKKTDQYLFEPLNHTTTHYTHPSTEQDLINRMLSSKIVGTLTADDGDTLCKNIRSILDNHGLDQHALAMPYRVEMYWTKKVEKTGGFENSRSSGQH